MAGNDVAVLHFSIRVRRGDETIYRTVRTLATFLPPAARFRFYRYALFLFFV